MQFTREELLIYGAIAGFILGLILGLVILIVGIKKGKKKLGLIGLICSIVVGPISGILSIIVLAVFLWLILKKPSTQDSNINESTNETEVL